MTSSLLSEKFSTIVDKDLEQVCLDLFIKSFQKQPPRGVLRKRCSENMQQIYRRKLMPKYDFNKSALQLYCSHNFIEIFLVLL